MPTFPGPGFSALFPKTRKPQLSVYSKPQAGIRHYTLIARSGFESNAQELPAVLPVL